MRQRRLWGVILGLGVLAAAPLCAQAQTEVERFQRQLEQIRRDTRERVDLNVPPEQRTRIDYGGYFTLGFLRVEDSDGVIHNMMQNEFTGYGRLSLDGVHEFFVRGRATYSHFDNNHAFYGSDHNWDGPVLERGTYRFDLARAMQAYEGKDINGNVVFEAGRQLQHWANGLVLSRTLDGGTVSLSYDKLELLALAGVTVRDEAELDSGRVALTHDYTARSFYGGMLSYQATPRHRPYVYGLVQVPQGDSEQGFNNDNDVTTSSGLPGLAGTGADGNRNYEYESHYIAWGSTGAFSDNFVYGLEAAYQGGSRRYSSQDVEISAFALDATLDYLFNDANRTRISSEFIIASGDRDPLGGRDAAPTSVVSKNDGSFNAFGLLNTGLSFNPEVSNLVVGRLGGSTFPVPSSKLLREFQIGIDGLVFTKYDADSPTSESTNDDSFLGGEVDLWANWKITSDLSLAVRYGVFFPGPAITASSTARHFVYSGLTFSF